MSGELSHTKVTNLPLVRLESDFLKFMGLRYGAPIHRAGGDFSRDDLMRAMFGARSAGGYRTAELTFTAASGERIGLHVTTVHGYLFQYDEDFLGNLFPRPLEVHADNCFVIEGLLLEAGSRGEEFAAAAAYGPGSVDLSSDDVRFLQEHDELYLKVRAVVAFDGAGGLISAIVQKLPSPADQILSIPPV